MKMKWSYIIVIVMSLFIIMIVSMAIKMGKSNVELYETDYYQQGEDYAQRMEQENVAKEIKCSYNYSSHFLEIQFTKAEGIIEAIRCIKLSDAEADFNLDTDNSLVSVANIPLNLSSGIWVIEIKGTLEGNKFFKKLNITL